MDPLNPVLAGFYDTYPGFEGLFNGAWGTYPFQNSCNIYISDFSSKAAISYKLLLIINAICTRVQSPSEKSGEILLAII